MKKGKSIINGEPVKFMLNTMHYIHCCDCQLVHAYFIERINKNSVILKIFRDDYVTDKMRKKLKEKK